jgi:glutamate--cysteine ligase
MAPGRRLERLSAASLHGLRRGIEKESLRVRADGVLARTPHPPALGSALTHPQITTDFSEAQLELITGVHASVGDCLAELADIHAFVHAVLREHAAPGDELVWAASMPCSLPADAEIPIGRYGSSNSGRLKTLYRMGLAARYGPRMQTISGIHYNFSLPDAAWGELLDTDSPAARTSAYFGLIRNFKRESWLLLYLFGASPAVCSTFLDGRPHPLLPLSPETLYLPHATALRMGGLGYQSAAQAGLPISYNSLATYGTALQQAITEPYPAYAGIPLDRQLSTALLQIENEFYGSIRPKRRAQPGERPLAALNRRGVEYVEVRLLDLDPFSPIGVEAATLRFIDAFLLHCLLADSPPDTAAERAILTDNQRLVVERGREPGLLLRRPDGRPVRLADWGREILAAMAPVAGAMTPPGDGMGDDESGRNLFQAAVDAAAAALADPARTPSARVLDALARHDQSFARFGLAQSRAHAAHFRAQPMPAAARARHAALAERSLAEQARLEAADVLPFEAHRRDYLAQDVPVAPEFA